MYPDTYVKINAIDIDVYVSSVVICMLVSIESMDNCMQKQWMQEWLYAYEM